jgi:hypothetical protein
MFVNHFDNGKVQSVRIENDRYLRISMLCHKRRKKSVLGSQSAMKNEKKTTNHFIVVIYVSILEDWEYERTKSTFIII